MPNVWKHPRSMLPWPNAPDSRAQDVAERVKLPIATEKKVLQFERAKVWMPPCWGGPIVPVKVGLNDPACLEELVILLGTGNRRQYVERGNIGIHTPQNVEMLTYAG